MIDLFNQAVGLAFGATIVVVLMSIMYKRDAVDWEQLVRVYGRDWQQPRLHKKFANMILYSDGRMAKSYKGIISIGLLDDGVALRPNRILAPFQRPIFIPYSDIQGWNQRWYIDGKSTELSFSKAAHMRLIMPQDQVEWMLSLAGGYVRVSEARPPHGTWPWVTFISALVLGFWALAVLIASLMKLL